MEAQVTDLGFRRFRERVTGVVYRPIESRCAIYSEEHVPDGTSAIKYNSNDPNTGHDHRFFIDLSRTVFAD